MYLFLELVQSEANFLIYIFGFLISISLGSYYITTAVRILNLFYGKQRKNKTLYQKLKLLFFFPSSCDSCNSKITPLSLTPVIGYFITKRKCSNCGYKVPFLYPSIEILFGIIFLLLYHFTQNPLLTIFFLLLVGHLLVPMYTDWKKFFLDYENIPFLLFWGILTNYQVTGVILNVYDIYVFLGFLTFYLLVWFLYKRGTGLGDVIFAPFFAFLAGYPWWLLFLNSSYLLALLLSYATRDKAKPFRKIPIPMGFYFGLGLVITFIAKIYYYSIFY